jgi:hypothetical protein
MLVLAQKIFKKGSILYYKQTGSSNSSLNLSTEFKLRPTHTALQQLAISQPMIKKTKGKYST